MHNTVHHDPINVYERPFKRNLPETLRLICANFGHIVVGSLLFILRHPLACWPILFERLKCIFFGATKELRTPEGFVLRHTHHYYIYGNIFIEQALYHRRLIEELRDAFYPLVIDVGSNIGIFTQWIASYNQMAFFVCFEPCLEYYLENQRVQNQAYTNNQIDLHLAAVGDYDGLAKLTVTDRVALGSEGRDVPIVRLDTFPEFKNEYRIFLIKIDTDGSNLQVLKGARGLLDRTRFVLIEKEIDEEQYAQFFPGWTRSDLGNDYLFERP
jgi:FkbM family methyltransferase